MEENMIDCLMSQELQVASCEEDKDRQITADQNI